MDHQIFEKYIQEAMNAHFTGWDFSYCEQFDQNQDTEKNRFPWDYRVTVQKFADSANVMLDIGTGGGEFLSSLRPIPAHTYATESYKPNISIAKQRLEPLGIEVVADAEGTQENSPLPFENQKFDLVINRHSAFETKEIFRVLKPGGIFITQQMGPKNNKTLKKLFGSLGNTNLEEEWGLKPVVHRLKDASFHTISIQEHMYFRKFYDIRALIYYLKAIPWEYPDFKPENHYSQLYEIFQNMKKGIFLEYEVDGFFIIAKKM